MPGFYSPKITQLEIMLTDGMDPVALLYNIIYRVPMDDLQLYHMSYIKERQAKQKEQHE